MKKIFLFMGVVLFSLCLKQDIFAFTFPADFNYTKAGTMIENNEFQYSTDYYYVSRYPDQSGTVYTQNFSWNNPVYTVGYWYNGSLQIIICSTTNFTSERYNSDGSFNNNSSFTGFQTSGALLSSNTNWASIGGEDIKTMLLQTDKTWYQTTQVISQSNYSDWIVNVPIYASADDFLQTLYDNNYNAPVVDNGQNSSGDLPFLSYTLEKQVAPVLSGAIPSAGIKEIFKWDYTEKEPYRSTPQGYTFDIMAYANFHDITTNIGTTANVFDPSNLALNPNNRVYVTRGGNNIAINSFSFMYKDVGQAVYNHSGKTFTDDSVTSMQEGYILGIRTRDNSNTQFSYWKLFIVQAGGIVTSTGKVMKNDGSVIDSTADNSNDNMGTGNGQNNGGVPGYTTDGSTTAGTDTTSTIYDETSKLNIGTLIGTLKSLVNSISSIPAIFAQLVTFIPDWFTNMLMVSIGLIVTIGIVKIIIR